MSRQFDWILQDFGAAAGALGTGAPALVTPPHQHQAPALDHQYHGEGPYLSTATGPSAPASPLVPPLGGGAAASGAARSRSSGLVGSAAGPAALVVLVTEDADFIADVRRLQHGGVPVVLAVRARGRGRPAGASHGGASTRRSGSSPTPTRRVLLDGKPISVGTEGAQARAIARARAEGRLAVTVTVGVAESGQEAAEEGGTGL